MVEILLTGGTGFVGRSIKPILESHGFRVTAPRRAELNVIDEDSVNSYLKNNKFDILIHCAQISPLNNPELDKAENMLEYTLRGFYNIMQYSSHFDKVFYTGSGAEYNKQFDIISAKEEDIGKHIPHDAYGFAKYIMNQYARTSSNVYNFRLFGIYGPTDCKGKFIRDAIDCCLENRAVTIRQNCMFDYLYVDDLGHILAHFIEHEPQYHDYNICSGKRVSLLEIAKEVSSLMNNHLNPVIAKEGWNREYTGSNERLISEFPQFKFTSLEAGITKQIKWQREL